MQLGVQDREDTGSLGGVGLFVYVGNERLQDLYSTI